jgi:GntR family transcriptional regulator
MAVDLRVNANTVARVYAELERAGVLETRRGVGTTVSAKPVDGALADRLRRLDELAVRFLADAATLGFGAAEAAEVVVGRSQPDGGKHGQA